MQNITDQNGYTGYTISIVLDKKRNGTFIFIRNAAKKRKIHEKIIVLDCSNYSRKALLNNMYERQ